MDYKQYANALRNCYNARCAEDCARCPYDQDGDACDEVRQDLAADVIEELWEQLEQAQARDAWVLTEERMPVPGEDVLVYCTHHDLAPWQSVAHLDPETGAWVRDDGDLLRYPVSHWRYLPDDPEPEGEMEEVARDAQV